MPNTAGQNQKLRHPRSNISVSGSVGKGTIIEAIQEYKLENGLKVILRENHKAAVVALQLWYRAGARNEPWGKSGLGHLFEHMMFKGTENVSAEQFNRRIQETGATYNAFTSHDSAAYFEKMPAGQVLTAMELEADRMQHLTFTREEFETEKQVVLEERRLRIKDNPQAYLLEQVNAAAFQTQPYHWPVSGWIPDLRRLSAADAKRWYETYYHPANACLVAVGDLQHDRLMEDIRKTFGRISTGKGPFREEYTDPPQTGERRLRMSTDITRSPFIIMGYHAPNLSSPDSYVLEVISAIFSSGLSARLLMNLVSKKRIARRVQSWFSFLGFDPDLFVIQAEPFPDVDMETLEKAIDNEIEKLQDSTLDEREIEKSKNWLEAKFIFAQDSFFHQAMLLARYELTVGWQEVNNYIPSIRAVSAGDIRQAARRYLIPENRTVGLLMPNEK